MSDIERRALGAEIASRPYAAWLPGLAAILCALVILSPAPELLRLPFALALILWLPGSAGVSLVMNRLGRAEACVLSIALSVALAILCGLLLDRLGMLDARGWAWAMAMLIVGFAAIKYLSVRSTEPVGPPPDVLRWSGSAVIMLILAALLSLGVMVLARRSAMAPDLFRYTEFWMVPSAPGDGAPLTIGIRNAEGVQAAYEVELLDGGRLVGRWPPVTLAPNATRAFDQGGTRPSPGRRLEARLYRDGDRGTIYRRVWTPENSVTEAR